jgi:hypothetical protein
MADATKPKQLNVLLEPEDRQRLAELAKREGLHASQIIRNLIRSRHSMKLHGLPTCADGAGCRCPQMHTVLTPATPTEPITPPAAA